MNNRPTVGTFVLGLGALIFLGAAAPETFEDRSERALEAMEAKAKELGITGVAVVAEARGKPIRTWTSTMRVVGKLSTPANDKGPGANLLAIAYAKTSEMADSLMDSGHAERPKKTGETGWKGGVCQPTADGFLFASFSGGPSEDDVQVARAGLACLAATP